MRRDRQLMLLCNDHCSILVFEAWDVGSPEQEWFAEVFKRPAKASWKWRARKGLGLLLGKEPVIDDICLDNAAIVALRDFLNECYPEPMA